MVFWRDGVWDKLAISQGKGPRGPASGGPWAALRGEVVRARGEAILGDFGWNDQG